MADKRSGSHSSIEKEIPEHAEIPRQRGAPRTPLERQIALKAALEVDPGVTRFSFRAIQVRGPILKTDGCIDLALRCTLLLWSFAVAPVTVGLTERYDGTPRVCLLSKCGISHRSWVVSMA
jgi:hypothetical protein